MYGWLLGKTLRTSGSTAWPVDLSSMPAYVQEFEAAWERTRRPTWS